MNLIRSSTFFWCAVLLIACCALGRNAWSQEKAPPRKEPAKEAKKEGPEAKSNAAPLPEGAVRRLGQQPGQAVPPGESAGHTSAVAWLSFSPDGTRLASWGQTDQGARIRVWDVSTGKELVKIKGDERAVFSPNGKYLLTRSSDDDKDDEAVLWDVASGAQRSRIPVADLSQARMLPDGKCMLIHGRAEVTYADVETGKISRRVTGTSWGTPIAVSRDGGRLAFVRGSIRTDSQGETMVHLGDVSSGADLTGQQGLRGKQGGVPAGVADFSPESLVAANRGEERLLAVGGYDATVHIWDIGSRRLLWQLKGHTGRVHRVLFSPDGRFLVTAGLDQTVRLWDLSRARPDSDAVTLTELLSLRGHAEHAASLAFSPDGRLLATGGNTYDRTIVMWDFWKLALGEAKPLAAPTDAQLQALWNELASDAPGPAALAAVGTLVATPAAQPFLRKQIDPYVLEAQRDRIAELIKQLDDGEYTVREAATEALIRLRRQTETALRAALRETRSHEVYYRLRRILSAGNATPSISPAETRRFRRLTLVLERLGTPEAKKMLADLSEVFPSPDVMRDARESLARLAR